MATKNELEGQLKGFNSRLAVLEEGLMQTSRSLQRELNSVTELLARVRQDLDRVRAEHERTRNTVDTIKNLQANYDIKSSAF